MSKRIRPARHYQHPQAPVRRLADNAIPRVARALRDALLAAKRTFNGKLAKELLEAGLYWRVHEALDWGHVGETMRRPLGLLADVWLDGGELGERKLNGAFTSRRRVVRFKKMAAAGESHTAATVKTNLGGQGQGARAIYAEDAFAATVLEKAASDLFNFDRYDPVTQSRIREFQDDLIRQLGVDSRGVIEDVVLGALRAGVTADEIVDQIRAVIGLTSSQARAVLTFRAQLLDMDSAALARALMGSGDKVVFSEALAAGRSLGEASVEAMVARYESNYLDHRALVIATTEATRAASLGLADSYRQAVARGALPTEAVRQVWQVSLDERTCDHCLSVVDLNPDGVGLNEMFQSDDGPIEGPPYHPNCRCSVELVTNLDLVPDDAFE